MPLEIIPVTHKLFTDWLRLREAVYTGIDREFHRREMELIFADETKLCLLAVEAECGSQAPEPSEAHSARQVVGVVELSLRNVVDGCLSSPVGYVEGIYVDPARRGKAIASNLLQHAEAWFKSKGCTEMATDAELDNEGAQQFHRQMGFEETYRIVEFKKAIL